MASVVGDLVGGKFVLRAPMRVRDVIKTLPGSRYSPREQVWTVPAHWAAAVQLRAVLGNELAWTEEANAYLWEVREYEERLAAMRAAALDPAKGEDLADRWPTLLPYQRTAVDWLLERGGGLLTDEMGVGKTHSGVMWAAERGGRALIVVPKAKRLDWLEVCRELWPDGCHAVTDGTPAKRRKIIAEWESAVTCEVWSPRGGALIVSWEDIKAHSRLAPHGGMMLTDAQKAEKELNGIHWTSVVADECHRAKNPKALQTLALAWLAGHSDGFLGLTGTPVANDVTDSLALLRLVCPAEWGARSKLVDRYVQLSYNFWGGATVEGLNPQTREEFEALASGRWMLRRTKALVLPHLPKKRVERRWVEMSPKQRKAYTELQKDMFADLDGGQLVTFSPLTLASRLNQVALATPDVDADGEVILVEPAPKLDALLDVWEDAGRAPMAVLGASRRLLDLCAARLTKLGIPFVSVLGGMKATAMQEAKSMFNSGQVDVILISLGAGAEGLSLTRGSLEVYLDRSWSQVKNLQGDDRMHGYGRGDADAEYLTVVEILTRGTVEEGRIEVLEKKGHQLQEITRDVELMKAVLGYAG